MITIKELQEAEAGQKVGGFANTLTVKKTKKMWQVGDDWIHQVVLMDKTGEMLADVCVGEGRNPICRATEIYVQVAEIRQTDVGKILYVDQWRVDLISEPPFVPSFQGEERVVRSKIKCWLVAATIQAGEDVDESKILKYVDFIMK